MNENDINWDPEEVLETVKFKHILNSENKAYSLKEIFQFNTGYHFLGKSTHSDFDKYGVGMSLYFKFLKNMMYIFLLFSILSIPIIKICTDAFYQLNIGSLTTSQTNLIFGTSLGPIGENVYSCSQYKNS
jgi:hypothetical protein